MAARHEAMTIVAFPVTPRPLRKRISFVVPPSTLPTTISVDIGAEELPDEVGRFHSEELSEHLRIAVNAVKGDRLGHSKDATPTLRLFG